MRKILLNLTLVAAIIKDKQVEYGENQIDNNIKSVEKMYKHFVFALYIDLFLSRQNSVLPAQDRKLGRFNKNAQRFLVIFKHVLSNRIQSYIRISF